MTEAATEADAHRLPQLGDVQFVLTIPADFSRLLLRGERPFLLIEADATDPTATGPALAAVRDLSEHVLDRELVGPLARLRPRPAPSISKSTPTITPKTSPNTTSCPASGASRSP